MSRRVDEQRVAELALLGWPAKRIAREMGFCISAIHRVMRDLGLGRDLEATLIRDRELAARIVVMTKRGWSAQRIADTVGCHQRTITRIRSRIGIAKPPSRPMTTDEIARAEVLLADGCSMAEVERTLGRAPGSLAWRFKGRGWTHQEVSEFGGHCSRIARLERKRA